MDILIKMREDIFAAYFLIWCPSDFNYWHKRQKDKNTVWICKSYIEWQAESTHNFTLHLQKPKYPGIAKVRTVNYVVLICLKIRVGFFSLKWSDPTCGLGLIKQMFSSVSSHLFPCSGNGCTNCSFDPPPWPVSHWCDFWNAIAPRHRREMNRIILFIE